ncbi:hypothetical protein BGX26_012511 [Mortierella sp. AD094]|nr:hypothetical protein BGX26_012511 [Mortierella sp. AD094]
MFGISETQKQRGDYIRELERASPAVTLFARVRFRLVMAAYPLLQWWFFGKPNRDSDRDSDSDSESESGSDSESESDSGSDSGSNSALMIQQENEEDKEGYTEVYQLLKHGTQCGVTLYVFDSVTRKDQFSDRIISDHYDKRAESINVLYLVSEVLTHRLSRKECEKLVMRHLEMMLRIAIKAVGQTGGDMATPTQHTT